MGHGVRKTEHAGAKKGNGAYWGIKQIAKSESNRLRREIDKLESLTEGEELNRGEDNS